MADKLVYIPNIDTHKYHFCRLQLMVETSAPQWTYQSKSNRNPKFLSQRINKKRYYITLGTSVIIYGGPCIAWQWPPNKIWLASCIFVLTSHYPLFSIRTSTVYKLMINLEIDILILKSHRLPIQH